MLKKLLSTIFAFILLINTSLSTFALVSIGDLKPGFPKEIIILNGELDYLDAVLAAGGYLGSVGIDLDCTNVEVVPLYGFDKEITSYYVSFSSAAYAVINNNKGNPSAIEFGEGQNERIREIIDFSSSPLIVYSNPLNMWDVSDTSADLGAMMNMPSLYDTYPDLEAVNIVNATLHTEMRMDYELMLSNMSFTMGDGDYGFLTLPSGTVSSSKTITSASSVSWAVMSDFDDIATNHCGSTAVTNLALYYHQRGHAFLKIGNIRTMFETVHDIVGNGPTVTIAGSATTYFSNRACTLNYSSASTQSSVKTALDNNRPLGTLLADGLLNWHWIITVGYREYTSGDFYMQVVTGWRDGIDRYYKPGSGSVWMSSTQYWVS